MKTKKKTTEKQYKRQAIAFACVGVIAMSVSKFAGIIFLVIASVKLYAAVKEKKVSIEEEQRKVEVAEKTEAFNKELDAIPSAYVGIDGEKQKVNAVSDIVDIKYSSITKKSNYSLLGEYVSIDVETCGLKTTDPIIEVSAVRFDGFEPVEKFTTLINPECPIPPDATRVNNITDAMVAEAPKIYQVMPSLNAFIGRFPLVGHNLPFDLKFLYRYGLDIGEKRKLYDTLEIAKRALKQYSYDSSGQYKSGDVYNYKLETCCEYYGIKNFNAHRSESDAYVTGKLFEKLVEDITS